MRNRRPVTILSTSIMTAATSGTSMSGAVNMSDTHASSSCEPVEYPGV
ncbi:hypothetical protein [Bifidobacterium canis]|uniref:Uncharacterized protein n=1 Tax=Bifidobacterium canis TaxID=2610880 RepID=A0A7K1J2A1_9BIFI|nr:hypothetical protein [Bifidobacterium canis]MUH58764.1 hypothetical protein [Bifidobacterium canis]